MIGFILGDLGGKSITLTSSLVTCHVLRALLERQPKKWRPILLDVVHVLKLIQFSINENRSRFTMTVDCTPYKYPIYICFDASQGSVPVEYVELVPSHHRHTGWSRTRPWRRIGASAPLAIWVSVNATTPGDISWTMQASNKVGTPTAKRLPPTGWILLSPDGTI